MSFFPECSGAGGFPDVIFRSIHELVMIDKHFLASASWPSLRRLVSNVLCIVVPTLRWVVARPRINYPNNLDQFTLALLSWLLPDEYPSALQPQPVLAGYVWIANKAARVQL